MGSWNGYHLTIGVERRDPYAVAAELRAELERVVPEFTDERRVSVTVEDDCVRWTTGESYEYGVIEELWHGDFVVDLDVPAAWALGVREQEAEGNGGATLYAWVDGEYVAIDDFCGLFGRHADDAVEHARRQWGVEGETVHPW